MDLITLYMYYSCIVIRLVLLLNMLPLVSFIFVTIVVIVTLQTANSKVPELNFLTQLL